MAVFALTFSDCPASSDDSSKAVDIFYDRVQKLIADNYPKANFERQSGTFKAFFKTRTFMIHHPYKTGEWQEARAQEGPQKGGILCYIVSAQGPYVGAAVAPQTFDCRYFRSTLNAPYNKQLDRHLIAHLDFPSDVSAHLLQKYSKLMASFEESK
jgi:hypothetical protein